MPLRRFCVSYLTQVLKRTRASIFVPRHLFGLPTHLEIRSENRGVRPVAARLSPGTGRVLIRVDGSAAEGRKYARGKPVAATTHYGVTTELQNQEAADEAAQLTMLALSKLGSATANNGD
jgi:hypothetical protein